MAIAFFRDWYKGKQMRERIRQMMAIAFFRDWYKGALVLALALAPMVGSPEAYAQSVASIVGYVTDPSASAVPAAKVVLLNSETGIRSSTVTDNLGNFLFPQLPVGIYQIHVEAPGFRVYEQSNITLQVGQRQSLKVQLQVGSTKQSIQVSGSASQVDTSTSELGTVIDPKRIEDLPLNGRDPLQLMTLVAGVAPATAARVKQVFTYANTFVAANGGRSNSMGYILEGGDNTDFFTEVAQPFPNPDALEEFRISTNNYNSEYGHENGGMVVAVIRSGTNQFHGDVFEYVRNYDLNATNFFSPGVPDGLKRNQYGFTFGGPVRKDRTFFFASYQGTSILRAPANSFSFAPTAAERNGDFSAIGEQLTNPMDGQPFEGNQIPPTLFDPASTALMKYIPLPNSGSDLVRYQTKQNTSEYQWIGKLDYLMTNSNKLSLSFMYTNHNDEPSLMPNDIFTAVQGVAITVPTANANLTSTLRPNLLNVAHISYSRQNSLFRGVKGPDLNSLGVQQPNLDPGTIGELTITNYFDVFNAYFPEEVPQNTVELRDDLSWIKGRHELKFGAEYMQRQAGGYSTYQSSGQFWFSGQYSGNNLSDFFLGLPSHYALQSPNYNLLRYDIPSFYAEDSFRVSHKLTLNFGMRYDPFFAPSDHYENQGIVWKPGAHSTRFPDAPVNLLFPGDPGVNGVGVNNGLNNWAPRVGFAFDPKGNGKMAIRGGYGVFYEEPDSNIGNALTGQPPFVNLLNITPPESFSHPFAGQPPFNPTAIGAFTPPVAVYGFDTNFVTGNVQQWNLTVEKQLPDAILLRAAYVGSKGTHLPLINDENAGVYRPGATESNLNQRRVWGTEFSDVMIMQSVGNSTYNALQLTLEKQYRGSLTFLSNYTYSKALDDMSVMAGLGNPPIYDPFNNHGSKGYSDFDAPSRFVTSALWTLPTLANSSQFMRQTLGGWQLNGILTASSGTPFTVTSGVDNSFSGLDEDHADQIMANPNLSGGRSTGQKLAKWFNTTAFTTNAIGTFGNTGRNILRGPGFFNLDASLFKNFPIKERFKVQFRLEFFNLLNHPNFPLPDGDVSDPTFGEILPGAENLSNGQVSSPFDARNLQLALKFIW